MREGRPSRTAYKVAMNLVAMAAVPEMDEVLPAGAADATARLLVASGAANPATVRWVGSPKMAFVYRVFDRILPGQFVAFGHRKAFCERQVRAGIASGAEQVLVLGAGYDTLGWRLAPEFPEVRFFEIDHPATARLKATGIAEMGNRRNLLLIPEDLNRRSLAVVLEGSDAWRTSAQTVIIAEGLVMYLPPDAVLDMFRQCASATGADSRIGFSHVPARADGRPDLGRWTRPMLLLLRITGEPWLWSILPDDLPKFLEQAGWAFDPGSAEFRRKFGVEFYCAAMKRA